MSEQRREISTLRGVRRGPKMPISRIVLYAQDMGETIRFYEEHFGFVSTQQEGDRMVELAHPEGGVNLMIHKAGRGQRDGQSVVKLVFDVEDVENFHATCKRKGLAFGTLHRGDGYLFANARDPSNNPISISSRAFRQHQ
jgi:predicted enzyme related to lactoylglutathione lyase